MIILANKIESDDENYFGKKEGDDGDEDGDDGGGDADGDDGN